MSVWNVVSFFPEYFLLMRTYKSLMSSSQLISQVEGNYSFSLITTGSSDFGSGSLSSHWSYLWFGCYDPCSQVIPTDLNLTQNSSQIRSRENWFGVLMVPNASSCCRSLGILPGRRNSHVSVSLPRVCGSLECFFGLSI